MAIRENAQLRQLVNDYYRGVITADSYRNRRASLLDNIGAESGDEPDVTATRPTPPTTREQAPAAAEQPAAPTGRVPGGAGKWIIGVAAIVVIAVAAYFGMNLPQGTDAPERPVASDETGEPMGPGTALVDGFLTREDWTTESLSNFLLAWERLDESQRSELVDGRHYRRLIAQLHQRIREETALGTGPENQELSALTGFAEAIGAPYRQSSAAMETQAPRAPGQEAGGELPASEADESPASEADESPASEADESPASEAEPTPAESSPTAPQDDALAAEPQPDDDIAAEPVDAPDQKEELAPSAEATPVETAATESERSDPCVPQLLKSRQPYCRDALPDGGEGPALVLLPPGSFEMGSDRFESEQPVHQAEITRPIAMSVYEVSVAEYLQFCIAVGTDCPQSQSIEDAPVVSVSWDDAVRYTDWLTRSTGFKYRLPTEAEWEYAARAGTQTPYSFGDEITPSSAHWSESGSIDAPLARSERGVNRNPFRLYHMSGNVREWVQDSWYEDYRGAPADGSARINQVDDRKVVRGGSFRDTALVLRSAAREPLSGSHRDSLTGFRIVREISTNELINNVP